MKKSQIPYEAQIIRVADEFDALVSKRQYKSHIYISDALSIIIDNTRPQSLKHRHGKNNPEIVRALIKVILDDTAYEIFSLDMYLSEIKSDIRRLKAALSYKRAADRTSSQKKKDYCMSGYNMHLIHTEKGQDIEIALSEYIDTYSSKKKELSTLKKEVRKIKSLRFKI